MEKQNLSKPELEKEVQLCNWEALQPHLKRGALFKVSPTLDLVEVGFALVQDDVAKVGEWIKAQKLIKLDKAVNSQYDSIIDDIIKFLIVQPYVLIQFPAN